MKKLWTAWVAWWNEPTPWHYEDAEETLKWIEFA